MDETNKEEKGELLFSIVRMPNGAFDITRSMNPEVLGILTIEVELTKLAMLNHVAGTPMRSPTDPIDEIYIPGPDIGDGH